MTGSAATGVHMPSSVDGNARVRRRIVAGAAVGTAIEYYDFTIYAFLATILARVFFPKDSSTAALLATFAVFAISFFLRPIGGVLIGQLADRLGRKLALTITVGGMIGASFLIGFIPGFNAIGLAAPALLVALRCIQGLSAGGEIGTAASYVAEEAPDDRRGILTGLVNLGTVGGTIIASLVIALLRLHLDDAEMVEWGWRIPFLLSLPFGLIAMQIRRNMAESVAFEITEHRHDVKRSPVKTLLRSHPRGLLRILGLSLTSNAGYWTVFTYMGTYLQTQKVLDATSSAWTTTVTLALAGASMPLWARLSDWVGRKPVMITVNVLFLLLSYPLFVFAVHNAFSAIIAQLLLGQITAIYLSNLLCTLTESLPTSVRVSGMALGYNLASILAGGSAPYIATWLVQITGNPAAPAFFLMAATGIAFFTSVFMVETANRPLPAEG